MKSLINKLVREWAWRVNNGMPDPKDRSHLDILADVFRSMKYSEQFISEYISQLSEVDDETVIKYKDEDGKDAEMLAKTARTMPMDHPAKKAWDVEKEKEATDKKDDESDPTKLKASDFERKAGEEGDTKEKPKNNLDVRKELATDPDVVDTVTDFLKYLDDKQKEALNLEKRSSAKEIQKLENLRTELEKLPEDSKNTVAVAQARAHLYEGRENSGLGKNRHGEQDINALKENEDRLIKAYGDGSPEHVEKFVRETRSIKITEEYVDASYQELPKSLQDALNRKGKTGDAGKGIHFLGYRKKDGSITSDHTDTDIVEDVRGNTGTKDRGKLVWRMYLEQGGRCAYTGLPLKLESMDLEHVVAFDNRDKGEPTEEDYRNRENDKNLVLTASNVNQQKKDLNMKDYYEQRIKRDYDKTPEEFRSIGEVFEEANRIDSIAETLAPTLLDEGILKEDVSSKSLEEHFQQDDARFENTRKVLREVATTDEDKKASAGLKSGMGKTVVMSMGLTRGIPDKSGRRTQKFSESVYRAFLISMASVPVEEREKYKEGWQASIKDASQDDVRKSGKGREVFAKKLVERGLISDDVLDSKLGKVFK
jgi:hypothetical protein